MSFVPSTVRDIVKPLQYVEEGTTAALYGVTPTASPAFTAAGINVEINLDPKINSEIIRALGSEDYSDRVVTGEEYAFTLKSNMLNSTLAKYGTQAAGAAGTVGASLSFLFSKNIDGTENYTIMNGCRPISTTLSVNRGLWQLEQTWHCKEIKDETTTHGLTTPTFITAIPSGSPYKHQDQASPLTWNTVNYPEKSFSTTVTRDLGLLEVNGQVLVQNSRAALRNISWSAEVAKKDTALLTDFYNHAKRAMSYKIGTAETISYVDSVITSYSEGHSGTSADIEYDRISGEARTISIA